MFKRSVVALACGAVAIVGLTIPAQAGEVIGSCTNDAYISERGTVQKRTNYNTDRLIVGRDSQNRRYVALVECVVAGLPTGAAVSAARLELTARTDSATGTVQSHDSVAFSETTVTWNSYTAAGGYNPTVLGSTNAAPGQVASLPVPVAANGTFRYAIDSPSGVVQELRFHSSETANPPRLRVTYDTAPPPAEAPGVTTGTASNVTDTTATLNGTVDPNREPTTASFEYGLTTGYGSVTADQSVGSGDAAVPVSAAVSGLTPDTTYHFRVRATNGTGTSLGADAVFTTSPAPPPPPACTADVVLTPAPGELTAAAVTARNEHKLNRSVCVVLQAGQVYRESFILPFESGLTLSPITLDLNGATISGADVFALTPSGSNFTAVWPHNLGNAADPWPTLTYDRVLLNREAAFITHGGVTKPYIVVDDMAELADGTMFVDEAADLVTINPYPEHVGATSAEITVRPLVRSNSNAFGRGLVYLDGRKNVTIKNGTLERANGAVQEGTAGGVNGGANANWTWENLTVQESAWSGLGICCTDSVTYRNIDGLRTGGGGIAQLYQSSNSLIEDIYETGNNWRGAWPTPGFADGFRGWAVGSKHFFLNNVTVNGWVALSNFHHGFWLDSGSANVTVNNLVSAGNMRGVYTEANQGPITYNNALVCNNAVGGFGVARSNLVTIDNSKSFDNRGGQLYFDGSDTPADPDGGGPIPPIEGNNFTLRNSELSSVDNRGGPSGFLGGQNWLVWLGNRADDYGPAPNFGSTDTWEGNTWWHGDAARVTAGVFHFSSTSYFGGFADFAEWSVEVDNTDTWAASNPNAGTVCPAALPPAGYELPPGW